MQRPCEWCGSPFAASAQHPNTKTCGAVCRREFKAHARKVDRAKASGKAAPERPKAKTSARAQQTKLAHERRDAIKTIAKEAGFSSVCALLWEHDIPLPHYNQAVRVGVKGDPRGRPPIYGGIPMIERFKAAGILEILAVPGSRAEAFAKGD